ncbi:hypothetical protein BY996DRAFT_4581921 [Phakopsora pachyrhizi]|nr:hypothetical protein BY996DRAFT_4581921 [Phakopsora pachyrhizi]
MKMDDYLKNYPNGQSVLLLDFADQVGVTNFQCGIGSSCYPSQSCSNMDPRNWFALVSAHRFNSLLNQVYLATAYATSVITDVSPSMAKDLIPESSMFWVYVAVYVTLLAATITGIPSFIFPPGLAQVGWIVAMSSMYVATAVVWIFANLYIPSPPRFHTAKVLCKLQEFESHMQSTLRNFTTKFIDSPISSQKGLYGISKDGNLFKNLTSKLDTEDLPQHESQNNHALELQFETQANLEKTLKLSSLAQILRAQDAFIIRGGEPCNGDGPGGAKAGLNQLSYCDEDGIMMNIVLAGDESQPEKLVHNAEVIYSKYGLSTQLLTEYAWNCQTKFGMPKAYNPKQSFNTTSHIDLGCVFDLPVCDLTIPKLRGKVKLMGLLEVCRKIGGLPI